VTSCRLKFTRSDYERLMGHLFPGDNDEHGAVLLAGMSIRAGRMTLFVREIHFAVEGTDYVEGKIGYRALTATFIHRMITRARDKRLVYLAVHNHGSDLEVGFSGTDLESHCRGYPALLQIARGMPVGALVFGHRSIQADVWLADGSRLDLEYAEVIGTSISRLTPARKNSHSDPDETFDRQVRMFGTSGQAILNRTHVGIIGLGGVGSLLAEYLAKLGIGQFTLVDNDRIEESNRSRIVGARKSDVKRKLRKTEISKRLILQTNENANVRPLAADVVKESVARSLTTCDYLFLSADSMRARLVFNSLVHQYFIPGVQLGTKIACDPNGSITDIMSANRAVRPGLGCLWCNQLIDPTQLAKEAKTDRERIDQAYGTEQINPSVITLNAVTAAHAVNDFLLDYLCLRPEGKLYFEHFHFLNSKRMLVEPRKSLNCPECSVNEGRFGWGDGVSLPCAEG
jgi:hypothetical protein